MKKLTSIASVLAIASSFAWAGGSSERVAIESLKVHGATFTLVVVPSKPDNDDAYADSYMGRCARFTVYGTYGYLNGAFLNQPEYLSRKQHVAALDYLRNAFAKRLPVNLGWMGSGFMPIDASEPCVVRSRALVLMEGTGGTAVMSFHNVI